MNFVDPMIGVHTNTIEGNWSGVKTNTPKRYCTKKWMSFYLLREMIRRNHNLNVYQFWLENIFK
ncbi:hypothetical protein GVAV_000207 [Gurleya vavrai]